ncbi:MAG TPA: VOC family protein [Opitutus sp.]|nr:VOC family protein [Opitutus sp.]
MNILIPYLLFDGCCEQAMQFYQTCLGGALTLTKVKDSVLKDQMPEWLHQKTLHARLANGRIEVAASDWMRADRAPQAGNTVCLYLTGDGSDELQTVFAKLSDGADVTDPLRNVPFGIYGALNDKFGVRWMFQISRPEAH